VFRIQSSMLMPDRSAACSMASHAARSKVSGLVSTFRLIATLAQRRQSDASGSVGARQSTGLRLRRGSDRIPGKLDDEASR
jgi:hypothetical protein